MTYITQKYDEAFINGNSVGGYDELVELNENHLLDDLDSNFLET